jgi:hypothetical protein
MFLLTPAILDNKHVPQVVWGFLMLAPAAVWVAFKGIVGCFGNLQKSHLQWTLFLFIYF